LAERLGESLLKAGKINEAQLASVLERQVTMGGRLGTNLIELGYLTEQELTDFLSDQLRIPSAAPKDFEDIDPEVVKLVPAGVAKKYSMMPLHKERNTLIVAMVDPTDFEATSELAFITSCAIRPCLATEARIQYALETYYGISRELRYISILEEERKQKAARAAADAEGLQAGPRKLPTPEELEVAMKAAKEDLAQATSREEIITILLRQLSMLFERAVFFVLKKEAVAGFQTSMTQLPQEAIKSLEIPLTEASIFRDVIERRDLCHKISQGESGALDPTPGNQRLLKALGGPAPFEVLVAPVILKEHQVAALLYGDNRSASGGAPDAPSGQSVGKEGLQFIRKVMTKGELALEILILRKKLLEI
jgi:MshEN domain